MLAQAQVCVHQMHTSVARLGQGTYEALSDIKRWYQRNNDLFNRAPMICLYRVTYLPKCACRSSSSIATNSCSLRQTAVLLGHHPKGWMMKPGPHPEPERPLTHAYAQIVKLLKSNAGINGTSVLLEMLPWKPVPGRMGCGSQR